MGLYLCVFDHEENELDGLEVGSYGDWGAFVDAVTRLEPKGRGTRYPLLTMHSDSDGEWSAEEAGALASDLREIADAFHQVPPAPPVPGTWQAKVAKDLGLTFQSLYDSFFDVDGENLIDRLNRLLDLAQRTGRPVLFQ